MRQLKDVAIAGVGITRFDSYDGEKGPAFREGYELGTEAILHALQDADAGPNSGVTILKR
ncbi:MAG TPA: hypothetical protein VMW89_11040 [Desulfatiglandales bacterium]|nr:hypothetical protein [Desulfatiglandales bacterium]